MADGRNTEEAWVHYTRSIAWLCRDCTPSYIRGQGSNLVVQPNSAGTCQLRKRNFWNVEAVVCQPLSNRLVCPLCWTPDERGVETRKFKHLIFPQSIDLILVHPERQCCCDVASPWQAGNPVRPWAPWTQKGLLPCKSPRSGCRTACTGIW